MENTNQIISALYLAKTDNREKMLSDLILTVLYNAQKPITLDELIKYIQDSFHLTPITYEVEQCLEVLTTIEDVCYRENTYILNEPSKENIYKSILRGNEETEKRQQTFNLIVRDIFDGNLEKEEIEVLWKIFNEYLIECFLIFGRKAIDFFLPYKDDAIAETETIQTETYKKLNSERLIPIFKKLLIEYPERLNEVELRYLSLLANRAEKFYSLGIQQADYERIKNLQITDLVVFLDTNVLYSILSLHSHPENSAIKELVRIAKEKQVGLRLVYLPRTYSELQNAKNYLDSLISKETFRISHIKAMLNSDTLNQFARQYYENKLENSDYPHPSEKITYASEILKERSIIIYNNRFHHLENNNELIENSIEEYREFERTLNYFYDSEGLNYHLNKEIKKIEHDVFLREAVKELREQSKSDNELHFICLTIDKSLLHFDKFRIKREKALNGIVTPNFIFPSLFIRKIRPFIPIITNNYRKAFLTSLTSPTFERELDKDTISVQKSVSYFKKLGIDDEEIIFNCIRKELFLEQVEEHEKDSSVEEFIKSEIGIEIENVRVEINKLESNVKQVENEKLSLSDEKEKKVTELVTQLSQKETTISSLENRLNQFEIETKKQRELDLIDKKNLQYEINLSKWNTQKDEFIKSKWDEEKLTLNRNRKYCFGVILLTILPILVGVILASVPILRQIIESLGDYKWLVCGLLVAVPVLELFFRSYIFDKERVKEGWKWFQATFSDTKYQEIVESKKENFEKTFQLESQPPKKENLLSN